MESVIIILVTVLLTSEASDECTPENVARCLTPFINATEEMGYAISTTNLGSKEKMAAVCREYGTMQACLLPVRPKCVDAKKMFLKSVEVLESYTGYLCSESGFDTYNRNHECLNSEEIKPSIERCENTFQERRREYAGRAVYQSGKTRLRNLCKMMKDMLTCTANAHSICGEEAVDLLNVINNQSLKEIFEGQGIPCHIKRKNHKKSSTAPNVGKQLEYKSGIESLQSYRFDRMVALSMCFFYQILTSS
ncbi:uncharacterized protein LOC106178731 [Lingula anatina]|uniref:Uncharacterized protein LOC106178731 n=1 Tax=Lingula anatina TaxID=7574 RepID=A0A1S3K5F1_LINAN|nr:uncharacterized protein LOC106178731 [Lingula anatina]|eukprot:XP_013417486.1 uncharacterized protein LOC106178731 [Lingula anatina]